MAQNASDRTQPDVNKTEETLDQATAESVARPADPAGKPGQATPTETAPSGRHYDVIVLGVGWLVCHSRTAWRIRGSGPP